MAFNSYGKSPDATAVA